ncbi:MAG: hypothetical protein WD266_08260 [Balneolales bacterium]
MLDALIQSKTRLKLLLRFFLNPGSIAYLRGLATEFGENSNSVRIELNRFEKAGLIESYKNGNKKMYRVNTKFPLFSEFQQIAFKHFGIDQILDQVIGKLGDINAVYVTGELARGLDSSVIDITLIGKDVDRPYLTNLIQKSETLVTRKIRCLVYEPDEKFVLEEPFLLVYGDKIGVEV